MECDNSEIVFKREEAKEWPLLMRDKVDGDKMYVVPGELVVAVAEHLSELKEELAEIQKEREALWEQVDDYHARLKNLLREHK